MSRLGACRQELARRRGQPLGDGGHLPRRLPGAKNHLLMPLGVGPEVIDGSERQPLDQPRELIRDHAATATSCASRNRAKIAAASSIDSI